MKLEYEQMKLLCIIDKSYSHQEMIIVDKSKKLNNDNDEQHKDFQKNTGKIDRYFLENDMFM